MISLGVSGALGRMGSRVIDLALQSRTFRIGAVFEKPSSPLLGRPLSLTGRSEGRNKLILRVADKQAFRKLDVVIDFTEPKSTLALVQLASESKCGMVIGTTGLESAHLKKISNASKNIPILLSPNMSLGANLLFELARSAAKALDDLYDIEIIEAHHRHKKDAPSGTAKRLAEVIAKTKGWKLDEVAVYGRRGGTAERRKKEIGIHVIRAGEIVGRHTALFTGPGESIEITHAAASRDAFAKGAILASRFVASKKRGLYTMGDVLNGVACHAG